MSLYLLGISHKTSPIDIREQLSFSHEEVELANKILIDSQLVDEVVIFSTCNRTEIYCVSQKNIGDLIDWLAHFKRFSRNKLTEYSHHLSSTKVCKHLFSVASGLDSLILGEPQILGQIKSAYHQAKANNSVGSQLNPLFQEAFHVAKQVRSNTDLGKKSLSIVHAAVKLSEQFFDDYTDITALIIGSGKTGELAAKSLQKKNARQIIIANRTLTNAQKLAENIRGGIAISLSQINEHLNKVDIIISAVNSKAYILNKQDFNTVRFSNHFAIKLVLDLGVPRNIAPDISEIDDIYGYTVDDLSNIVDENKQFRQDAAKQAQLMIDDFVTRFNDWLNLKNNHHLIKQINDHAQQQKQHLITQSIKRLENGEKTEVVIKECMAKLTKKLMHQPNQLIRELGEKNNDELLLLIKEVYKID